MAVWPPNRFAKGTSSPGRCWRATIPIGRIESLKSSRLGFYDRSAVTFPVDRLSATDTAIAIRSLLDRDGERTPSVQLDAPSGSSEIYIEPGIRRFAGELIRERWPKARTVWIVSDEHVDAAHGNDVAIDSGSRRYSRPASSRASWRDEQKFRRCGKPLRSDAGKPHRTQRSGARAGRGRGRRPGRIHRRYRVARNRIRANADLAAGDGRFERRRQNRDQPSDREESHRSVLSAPTGA